MKKKYILIGAITAVFLLSIVIWANQTKGNTFSELADKNAAASKHEAFVKIAEEKANKYTDAQRPEFDAKTEATLESDYPGFSGPYEITQITKFTEIPLDSTTSSTCNFVSSGMSIYSWIFSGNLVDKPDEGIIYIKYSRHKTNETSNYFVHIPDEGAITLTGVNADKNSYMFKTEKGKTGTLDVSNKIATYKFDYKVTARPENQLQKDITFVKKNIKKGLPKDAVKGIMGKNYSEVTEDGPDGLLWRYDLSAVSDYKFENPYNNDKMDIDGLKNKKLTAELYVHWNEDGTLKNFEMIYLSVDHENSIVRLNADGVEKVDPIG